PGRPPTPTIRRDRAHTAPADGHRGGPGEDVDRRGARAVSADRPGRLALRAARVAARPERTAHRDLQVVAGADGSRLDALGLRHAPAALRHTEGCTHPAGQPEP